MITLERSRLTTSITQFERTILNTNAKIGLIMALICGASGYFALIFLPGNELLSVTTIFFLPLLIGIIITRNLSFALTLTWINEIFAGGSGRWFVYESLPGRWILLALVLFTWVISRLGKRNTANAAADRHDKKITNWIIFLGIVLPFWLVIYSVVSGNSSIPAALGDVDFLIALLVYFPMRDLLQKHRDTVLGWLLGSSLVLVVLLLTMSVGPINLRNLIVGALLSEGRRVGVTISGISRIGLVHIVLLFFPVFLSFFIAISESSSYFTRLKWTLFGLVALLPMSVTYLRGPLLASVAVLVIFAVAALTTRYSARAGTRIILILPLIIAIVAAVMLTIVPDEAISKFTVGSEGIDKWISYKRTEQSRFAIEAFREDPVFGKGVGVPLRRYSVSADYFDNLAMELEYHKLLYRFGGIAFILFLIPVLWFLSEPFRFLANRRLKGNFRDEMMTLASLAAVLGILIAGGVNPYLTTPFTPLFITIYLSMKGLISKEESHSEIEVSRI